MKYITASAALVATIATVGTAQAGGIERTGQSISALFQQGTYAELSYGYVTPQISGSVFGLPSGNMAKSYSQYGAAFKTDITEAFSLAVIFDQPYGADIAYTSPAYPLAGTQAAVESGAINVLARYKFGNFSIHGGATYLSANANVRLVQGGTLAYAANMASTSGTRYVIGAAYEKPEIALRAALTYRSEIDMSHDTLVGGLVNLPGGTKYTLPQSVELDFQTGIMADTLLMANVRWVDWSKTKIYGPNPANPAAPVRLISYKDDTITYSLGVGRKFTDRLSGSAMVSWERSTGKQASNLAPSDGRTGITLGAKYAVTDNSAISAGVNYTFLGDTTTMGLGGKFSDSHAVGVGVKYSFNF